MRLVCCAGVHECGCTARRDPVIRYVAFPVFGIQALRDWLRFLYQMLLDIVHVLVL